MLDPAAEPARLLPQLLAAWRDTRAPRIADLVDRVAAQLPARAALAASKNPHDLATWSHIEEKKDPGDFSRLAAAARGGRKDDIQRQVLVLGMRDDPRLGAALLALLEDLPYRGADARGLHEVIVDVLRGTQDRRLVEPTRVLARRYLGIANTKAGRLVTIQLERAVSELADLPEPSLSTALEAPLAALEVRFGRSSRALANTADQRLLAGLLAEVYAAPDDDGPRLVYADALTERGDPRGVFITLQIARTRGQLTRYGAKRLATLERDAKQCAMWALPLEKAGHCRFERGFPEAISLKRAGTASIVGDPAWNTVREVDGLEGLRLNDVTALLDHPAAAGVRHVGCLSPASLAKLCERLRAWTSVRVADNRNRPTPDIEAMLASAFAALPALAELQLSLALPIGCLGPLRLRSLSLRSPDPLPAELQLPITLETLEIVGSEFPDGLALHQLDRLTRLDVGGIRGSLHLPARVEHLSCNEGARPLPAIEVPPETQLRTMFVSGALWPGVFGLAAPTLRRLAIDYARTAIPSTTLEVLVGLEQLRCPVDVLSWIPPDLPLRHVTTSVFFRSPGMLEEFIVRYPDLESLEVRHVGSLARKQAGWHHAAATVWKAAAASRLRCLRLFRHGYEEGPNTLVELIRDPATGQLPRLPP